MSLFVIDTHFILKYHFCMTTKIIRSPVEIETRNRVKLAVWAFAYEFKNHSIVSDAIFDVVSYMVNLNIPTMRPDLDAWFRANFAPCTGMWVHNHPQLERIEELYERYYK